MTNNAENKVTDILQQSSQDISSNGYHILLVEDSVANQAIAMAYLNTAGYVVDTVADGSEAVKAVESRHYDLVLMDLSMPFMDGFEATKRIRKLSGDKSRIPIIAMTANTLQGKKEDCLVAGMNDYLPKPVNKNVLLTRIAQWLPSNTKNINSNENANVHHDQSYIDRNVLKQLEKDTSVEIASDIIKVFLRETDRRLKLISEACENVDHSVLQSEAHVLKSSAGIYGTSKLQQLAIKVDTACKEQRGQDAIEIALRLVKVGFLSLSLLSEYIGHVEKPGMPG